MEESLLSEPTPNFEDPIPGPSSSSATAAKFETIDLIDDEWEGMQLDIMLSNESLKKEADRIAEMQKFPASQNSHQALPKFKIESKQPFMTTNTPTDKVITNFFFAENCVRFRCRTIMTDQNMNE